MEIVTFEKFKEETGLSRTAINRYHDAYPEAGMIIKIPNGRRMVDMSAYRNWCKSVYTPTKKESVGGRGIPLASNGSPMPLV